jgi:hypothetical protein
MHLKNEGQEGKTAPFKRRVQHGGGRVNGEGEGGQICSMYFVYMYKN